MKVAVQNIDPGACECRVIGAEDINCTKTLATDTCIRQHNRDHWIFRSHMKCGTYMFLIVLKLPPPLLDPKCVQA